MTHAAEPPAEDPLADVSEGDEELVAYLDGELDDDGVRRVETRLAADAEYRQELAKLQTAWDCLDVLPETNIDPAFTRSTIEMVALAAREELAETREAWPRAQRLRRVRGAAMMLAGLALGFVLVTVLWPSPARRLARDLPVLENLDLYLPIDDLAYLRALSALPNLPPLEGLSADAQAMDASDTAAVEAAQGDTNRETSRTLHTQVLPGESAHVRLTQLTSTEKARLAASEQRFTRLQPAEQTRLRLLAEQVEAAADRERLRETLERYHGWLAALSPGEQAELAGLVPAQRLQAVEKLLAEQQRRRARELSAPDRKALLKFLETFVVAHRDELLKQVPESRRHDFTRMFERADLQRQSGMLLMMFWQHSRHAAQSSPLPVPSEDELRPLLDGLSPGARQKWEELKNDDERRRLMQSWIGTAIRHRMMERMSTHDAKQITQEQLEEFFGQEIGSEQRASLLAMPREKMERELRRLMLASEDTPSWRGFNGSRSPGGFHRNGFGPPRPPGEHGPGGFRSEKYPSNGRGPKDRPERHLLGPGGEGPEEDRPRGEGLRFDRRPHRAGRPGSEGDSRRFDRPDETLHPQSEGPGEKRPSLEEKSNAATSREAEDSI
jgi:anti-sigma factor RsiW